MPSLATDRPARHPQQLPQAGFSLTEALVTMVVLSIGLAGWALTLGVGMAYQQDALSRTQAAVLAYDLMERIRASRIPSADPVAAMYAKPLVENELERCDVRGAATPDNDRICWHSTVRRRLPHGTGRISIENDAYVIELFWFDANARRDPAPASQTQCEDLDANTRIWSANPRVNWVPASRAPSPATCLQVQRWVLPL